MAVSSSSSNLQEAMDELWFHKNILFSQPSNSMSQKDHNLLQSTSSSQNRSFFESVPSEDEKKQMVKKTKNHERLDLPTEKSSSEEEIPPPAAPRKPERRRSHCRGEKLCDGRKKFGGGKVEEERKPFASEAWFVNGDDSPLLNLSMLPETIEGAHMKKFLRFWAQSVAALVCHELYL